MEKRTDILNNDKGTIEIIKGQYRDIILLVQTLKKDTDFIKDFLKSHHNNNNDNKELMKLRKELETIKTENQLLKNDLDSRWW